MPELSKNDGAPMKPFIIGADECGTGSYCGPLVVCGIRAPSGWSMPGLNDSKKLSPARREELRVKLLNENLITYHIAERSNVIIDELGLATALKDAYVEVFQKLYTPDCQIIIDGTLNFDKLLPSDYDWRSEPKADTKYPAVMGASILGKTHRDSLMRDLSKQYPVYDWQSNVGYGAPKHIAGLKTYGASELHRFSYQPLKKYLTLPMYQPITKEDNQ